jgi:hypothetical protein
MNEVKTIITVHSTATLVVLALERGKRTIRTRGRAEYTNGTFMLKAIEKRLGSFLGVCKIGEESQMIIVYKKLVSS